MTAPKQTIETPTVILSINEEGIGHMHFKDHINFDIPEQMENLKQLIEITNNQLTPFVITVGDNVTITREARENAIKIEGISPMYGSAVVVQNFAYRLITDFYLKVQKPKRPFAVFTDKEKAIEWCRQFLQK
ncbi:hypothetical protein BH10BAC1_BH10BAC1_03960 [soil metagenome]